MKIKLVSLIIIAFMAFIIGNGILNAQESISLDDCLQAAHVNHPINGNKASYQKLITINQHLKNAYLKPSFSLASDARVQSEGLSLNLPIPNSEAIELPNYSIQLYGQIQYNLLTGNLHHLTEDIQKLELESNINKTDISIYKINEEIAQLYFNILTVRKSRDILTTINTDLIRKNSQIKNAIKSGIKSKLDLIRLEYEILTLEGQIQDARINDSLLCVVMNELTGFNIASKILLNQELNQDNNTIRKEIDQFHLAKRISSKKMEILDAYRKPKLGGFLRSGIGYPNPFNFFDDSVRPFALLGINFKWPIYDWNITKIKKSSIAVQNEIIDQNEKAFLWQQQIKKAQHNLQIERLIQQIKLDQQQLILQKSIIKSVEKQWMNGILNANDYLNEINKLKILQLKINNKEIQIKRWKSIERINQGVNF